MAIIETDNSGGWINEPRESPAEGVYGAKLKSWDVKENGNYALKIEITEDGEYQGAVLQKSIGSDNRDGNKSARATAFVALGMPREKALAANLKVDTDKLAGKKLHIYCRPKSGDEKYDTLDLLPPTAVADMQARYAQGGGHDVAANVPAEDDGFTAPAPAAKSTKANGKAAPAPAVADDDPFA